ncbi:MAG: putative magnesium/manganese-dependent protein phosphatase with domain [Ilumatobacteraceae bacterium]|nr:putative magnesium/manganese-dependent protein phosphatase with domain [Ilumatobacteraceae bacterium]MCU1391070.1 putative magnesium/manganese-dependent protein phosphatase with domain [Ilumatobacteraceae bacterium]
MTAPLLYPLPMPRNGIGGPAEPWNDAAWQARVQAGVTEMRRVSAVEATGLLDATPDESFDQLARLAAAVLGVPWVFVTLVDEHRSFWVSAVGVAPDPSSGLYGENPVGDSFCQYVIGADGAVVIDDARLDRRSERNPSIESMGVVAWAGFPLRSTDGHVVGTFCAVDRVVREWSAEDITLLHALASAATSHLQLRAALAVAEESALELAQELERRDLLVSRATMLAQLAQELSAVSTVNEVARVITTTGRTVLGAVFANLAVVDADRRHLDIVHSPPLPAEIAERYSRIVLSDDVPLANAVTRAATILVPDLDTIRNHYPHILDDTRAAGLGSTVSIPLFRADRSVAGAIGVGWSGPIEFTPIIRSVLTTVSEMCAQALDRSQVGDARTQFVRSLQYALLPSTGLRDGLDIAAEYIAANDALGFGGDWYDFIHISPTRTALVVGDICGHGIEAAARMTQVRGTINALVSIHSDQLGRLFDRAEQQLNLRAKDFVATLSVHVIDTETDTIDYVSAGHPPALLVDESGEARFLEDGRRPVLGVGGREPETARVAFAPGSILVAYTDGLVEQNRDFDDGLRRLSETVRSVRGETAREISNKVATTVAVNAPDDVAYTVIRRV